jgi:hypothetical protein
MNENSQKQFSEEYLAKLNNWHWTGEDTFTKIVEDNQKSGMIVVEIGCYDGSTTRRYIDTVKKNNGQVFVIDTFMGSPEIDGPHGYGDHNKDLYDVFRDKFSNYSDMLTILRGFSQDCIPNLPDQCDIIFIDADHKYQSCKRDIELSLTKMKKGGILSGHDFLSYDFVNTYTEEELNAGHGRGHHPGVCQAVYDVLGVIPFSQGVWFTTT